MAPIVIGLTGGIASGKSLLKDVLAKQGCAIIDADVLGHETYADKASPVLAALVDEFSPDILAPDGTIHRPALGAKVFGNPNALARLNAIVWPAIRQRLTDRLAQLKSNSSINAIVVEAAILIEAKWTDLVDEVWSCFTPVEEAVRRLASRNKLSEDDALKRIRSQMTNEEREAKSHVHLWNAGALADFEAKGLKLFHDALKRHSFRNADELVDIVDEQNRVVEARKRAVMRSFNLPHRATYVIIVHRPTGKLYVQTRSGLKEYYPGGLDPAPGGVVGAGETYEENAVREMNEEMGLVFGPGELKAVGDFWHASPRTRVWGRVLLGYSNVDPSRLKLQAEEVASVQLMSLEEINSRAKDVLPDSLDALRVWQRFETAAL